MFKIYDKINNYEYARGNTIEQLIQEMRYIMKFKELTLENKCIYVTYWIGKITIGTVIMFVIACLN